MKKAYSIRMDPELLEALKDYAILEGTTVADVLERAARVYLDGAEMLHPKLSGAARREQRKAERAAGGRAPWMRSGRQRRLVP